MPTMSTYSPCCRLAVCREEMADGKEWSIYVLNDLYCPVDVALDHVGYEWGDRGHSVAPEVHVHLLVFGSALLWRETWEGAEMNMDLRVTIQAPGHQATQSFELGKLYRKRNATVIGELGKPGWLQRPVRT